MSTSVSWPSIGGTTYSIPAAGEVNWQSLSNFLIALGTSAQSISNTKLAIRVATTTPVTVSSTTDCIIVTNLAVAGAVAINLPAGVQGQVFFIVDDKGDAATNNITIDPNGAETINGSATYVINKNRAGVLIGFNGVSWSILSEFTNVAAGTIPRSSIAAGSANAVVINDGSGNLSSEAQLAKSRGGTGADNSSVTFPASGVLVTRTSTDQAAGRLQSKDLDAGSVKVVDPTDTTKTVAFSASGAVTGADVIIASVATVDRTLTLPDLTDTLVSKLSSDTGSGRLKNKDLEASTVKFVDATDTTKAVKFDASGATAAATLTLASVASTNRTITLPNATTTLVGTDAAQVVTLKDIDGGTATNTSRITVPSAAIATLTALTRKAGTIVYGTDSGLFYYDNGTSLVALSSTATATPSAQGTVSSFTPIAKSSLTTITSANATATDTDGFDTWLFNTGASNRTFTLPTAANNAGRTFKVKKIDSGVGTVVITGTINGVSNLTLYTQYAETIIVCDGTGYYTVSGPVEWGTYTPSETTVSNIAAFTLYVCTYMRVGNMVTVFGQFDVDPTTGSATVTEFTLSLPIPATLVAGNYLSGSGSRVGTVQYEAVIINGNTSTNTADFLFRATEAGNTRINFSFQYRLA